MNTDAPRWLARTTDAGLGCYLHVPFCDRICPYCDFAVVPLRQARVRRYVEALMVELSRSPARGPLQTLYVGGGTPSALEASLLRRLLDAVFAHFSTAPGSVECTLEANPALEADLSAWREAGITRLSVGVQSFDDDDLRRLGRTHSGRQATEFCRAARQAGHKNISLDLIAGVPGQSLAVFVGNVAQAIALEVDHVSVYGLTVEEGTPYGLWHHRDPGAFADDETMALMLERAHDLLTSAGFGHYEISNFAKPGFESAHNSGYWRQRDCAALGMSAAGYEHGLRYRNHRDFDAYCEAIERGEPPRADEERLDAGRRLGEAAMLALRTASGIEQEDFGRRFGVDIRQAFAAAVKRCSAAGLLEQDARGLRLSGRGRLLANMVCAEFLEPQSSFVVST